MQRPNHAAAIAFQRYGISILCCIAGRATVVRCTVLYCIGWATVVRCTVLYCIGWATVLRCTVLYCIGWATVLRYIDQGELQVELWCDAALLRHIAGQATVLRRTAGRATVLRCTAGRLAYELV